MWQFGNQDPVITSQALQPPRSLTVPPESVTVLER